MRIVLHIGAWKTGSSAIQHFMSVSADDLRKDGVVAPADAMDADGRNRILKRLNGSDEDAAPLLAEIAALKAAGARTLVISNEHYWPLPVEAIQRIGARLKTVSDDINVLIYIRPQEEMWRSLHAQQAKKFQVKSGAAIWGTADYLPPVFAERAVHYCRTMQLFADTFGQSAISVRLYDRARFAGGDVVTDFLSHLGLDGTAFKREERDINRSVGWKGVAFAIWLADEALGPMQALNPGRPLGKLYIRSVKRTAEMFGDDDWIGRAAEPLTTAEKAAIRQHYADDNRRLFQTYFGGEDIFPEIRPGRGDPLSPEAIPAQEMIFAKRRVQKLADRLGYATTGAEYLFAPPPAQPRGVKRLLNALPFRAQKT